MSARGTRSRGARARLLRFVARLALRVGGLMERARRAPRAYILVLLNVTAISAAGLTRLEIDNRIETWTGTDEASGADFDEGDFLALVHPGPAVDEAGFLARDRRLTALSASEDGAREVVSVSAVLDRLRCRDLVELGDGARFLDGQLLTAGGELATVRVWLEKGVRRDVFVSGLRAALAGESPVPALLGPAAFNAALDERSRAESARVFPIAAGALVLLLYLLLGSATRALVVMAWALAGAGWLLGWIGWLGLPLDFVSISVPVILVVAELSLLLHPAQLLARARRPVSLRRLSIRTLPGAALSTLTSAGGFLTLALGPSPTVRRFGLLCAAAMLVALLTSTLALPILARLPGGSSRLSSRLHGALLEHLRSLGRRLERRPFLSIGGVAAVVAAGSALALRIPVDHQPLDFLSPREPLRIAYEELGDRAGGLAPLELSLDLGVDPWSAAGLRRIEGCAADAAAGAGTGSCFSLVDLVKLAAARTAGGTPGSYALPADDVLLEAASRLARLTSAGAIHLVSSRGACRLVLPLPLLGGREFQAASARVLERLEATCPGGVRRIGVVHRLMALQDGILASQASGLIAGLAGASLLLGAVLGSRRATVAAVLVNMAPLSIAAAYMSLRQVTLDLSTAMVASISLGISVDDSARFLWAYRRASRRGARPAALALEQAGPATVLTGIVLAAGFGIIALSKFPPIARFGAITAGTLLGSVICHVLILPGLLRAPVGSRFSRIDPGGDS